MYYTDDFDEDMMNYLLYSTRVYSDRGWSVHDDVLVLVTDTIAQTTTCTEFNNKILSHAIKLNKEDFIECIKG